MRPINGSNGLGSLYNSANEAKELHNKNLVWGGGAVLLLRAAPHYALRG